MIFQICSNEFSRSLSEVGKSNWIRCTWQILIYVCKYLKFRIQPTNSILCGEWRFSYFQRFQLFFDKNFRIYPIDPFTAKIQHSPSSPIALIPKDCSRCSQDEQRRHQPVIPQDITRHVIINKYHNHTRGHLFTSLPSSTIGRNFRMPSNTSNIHALRKACASVLKI